MRNSRRRYSEVWLSSTMASAAILDKANALGFGRFWLRAERMMAGEHCTATNLGHLPTQWSTHYRAMAYQQIDPILRRARRTAVPFCWQELNACHWKEQQFLDDARAHGLKDGITVPLHCASGEIYILSLIGKQAPKEYRARWTLYASAYEFLCAYLPNLRKLLMQEFSTQMNRASLTQAQLEVLHLLTQGRTARDIANMLGIHIRTVEDRISRARDRLQVSSRAQLIARAVANGQLSPNPEAM